MNGVDYNQLWIHRLMLGDLVRGETYRRAIESVITPDSVVLDMGAGSGILSFFAAAAGAKKVYAIERTDIVNLTRELAHLNGLSNRVEIIQADVLDIKLTEKVDVLVSEWLGLFAAVMGLVYLLFPGLSAPPFVGSALMAVAGISWGLYSLRGRRSEDPVRVTTGNFVRSVPFVAVLSLVMWRSASVSGKGALLALLSGALTSGGGYVVWYQALRGLTATRAAIVQLSVPVLAAIGGVVFLSETITPRLLVSTFIIIGGVCLAIVSRQRQGVVKTV